MELVAIGVLLFGSAVNLFGRWLLKGLIYIALAVLSALFFWRAWSVMKDMQVKA